MEESTAQVVEGAVLAHDAGEALEAIEAVSNELAQLIKEISNTAGEQAATAGDIAKTMGVIQDITTHTAQGVVETSSALEKLSDLSGRLRHSVAGFKLPA